MDCRAFEALLDSWLQGQAPAKELAGIEAHAAACARCRKLHALVLASLSTPTLEAPRSLTQAVLARTTGPACGRAGELLPELVEGTLGNEDAKLVQLHAELCEACAAMARALPRLTADLPLLAEMQPDPSFARGVLARTTHTPLRRLSARIARVWGQLVLRPRFELEGAYLGFILLLGLFVLGGSRASQLSHLALDIAATNPVSVAASPTERLVTSLRQATRDARARLGAPMPLAIDSIEHSWNKTTWPLRQAASRVRSSFWKLWNGDGPPAAGEGTNRARAASIRRA